MDSSIKNELYESMPCGIVIFRNTPDGEIIYANKRYYNEFSNGNTKSLNMYDEDRPQLMSITEKIEQGRAVLYYRCDIGREEPCRVSMSVGKYGEGAFIGVLWDATERYEMVVQMRKEKEKFAMAMCSSKNLVFEHNVAEDTAILYVHPENSKEIETVEVERFTDYIKSGIVHEGEADFFLQNIFNAEEETLSARMKLLDGRDWKWYRVTRQFEFDREGNLARVFGVIADIDDEKQSAEEMQKKIEIDPVLKIYNRNAGISRINSYIKKNPEKRDYALFVLDIDDFKNINDTYGHLYGDAVIEMMAKILNGIAKKSGIAGRYGGDEFFMFLHSMSIEEIHENADAVLNSIRSLRTADGYNITSSMGLCCGEFLEGDIDYKTLFERADKALYTVKNNGKAHWLAYDDEEMSQSEGHALDYAKEDEENDFALIDSKDMMKAFLELSAGAKTGDEAIYNILPYLTEKFRFDWIQIMEVNSDEDVITIRYEWCNDADFHNNSGRSGYYVHNDIMLLRNHFSKNPVFLICPENTKCFSPKFQREFEKNMRHAVVYMGDVTSDASFFMFVCTRFNKEHQWEKEEYEKLNDATKMTTMYISQSGRESENERKLEQMLKTDRKTGLYSIMEFYVQLGRLRKIAQENNEDVVLMHTDIGNFIEFNRNFGINAGDSVLMEFGKFIKTISDPEHCIVSHLDGTDIFYTALRVAKGDRCFIERFHNDHLRFVNAQNKKYPGAKLVIRSGFFWLPPQIDGGFGFDSIALAKKKAKNRDETFYVIIN